LAILDENRRLSRKWYEIGRWLLWNINRKWNVKLYYTIPYHKDGTVDHGVRGIYSTKKVGKILRGWAKSRSAGRHCSNSCFVTKFSRYTCTIWLPMGELRCKFSRARSDPCLATAVLLAEFVWLSDTVTKGSGP